MKVFSVFCIFAALWLAGCAGSPAPSAATQPPVETPSEIPATAVLSTSPTLLPMTPTTTSEPVPVDLPPAQLKAVEALAAKLGLPAGQIRVVEAEAVQWPDGCLGVRRPGVMCTQAIVPGFRLVLEAGGQQYEYHTDQDGSQVIEAPARAPASLALHWRREGGIAGFCDELAVLLPETAMSSTCRPQAGEAEGNLKDLLSIAERAQLQAWLTQYGEVNIILQDPPEAADAMTTSLTIYGRGEGQPAEAEQQAMLAWAQSLFERLQP